MGVFDYITVKYTLPITSMQNNTFQSKSLDCVMGEYEIDELGRLIQLRRIYEKTDRQIWNPVLMSYDTERVLRETIRHDEEYHGDIYFYDFDEEEEPHLITFKARFTHGTIESITQVKNE